MAKHTYYFKHDFNAHNDEKIVDLLMSHGLLGYGIFWYLIELLASADEYQLETNYKRLAFSARTKETVLKSVVEDFSLFSVDEGYFWSNSLADRMKRLDEIKDKRAKAGRKGGKAKGKQLLSKTEPIDKQIEAEKRREEKSIEEKRTLNKYTNDFEAFWTHWKEHIKNDSNKKTTFDRFKKISDADKISLFESISVYSKSNTDHQYLKRSEAYINQRHWEQVEAFRPVVRELGDF